jgi:hypothetical protein
LAKAKIIDRYNILGESPGFGPRAGRCAKASFANFAIPLRSLRLQALSLFAQNS